VTTDAEDHADADLWETHATWWQDEFTDGADPEYEEQIIPLALELLAGRKTVVDVGTGEGQIARRLAQAGSDVLAYDPTPSQIAVARRRGTDFDGAQIVYGEAFAHDLPVKDSAADGALACLVFEHITEVDAAITEVWRVLQPGGRFVFMLNHPLLQTPDAGWINDHMVDPPENYWRLGPYLSEAHTVEEVMKDVFIPFIHRPLSRYVNALADAGFVLRRMVEPAPPPGYLARSHAFAEAAAIPRLLVLVADKPVGPLT